MKIRRMIAGLAALILGIAGLVSCNPAPETPDTPEIAPINTDWRPNQMNVNLTSDSLFVQKVENLPDDFIFGMDASCVPALEASGVTYTDFDGQVKDVYEILSANGINYIRVRIWNDPFTADGKGYGFKLKAAFSLFPGFLAEVAVGYDFIEKIAKRAVTLFFACNGGKAFDFRGSIKEKYPAF